MTIDPKDHRRRRFVFSSCFLFVCNVYRVLCKTNTYSRCVTSSQQVQPVAPVSAPVATNDHLEPVEDFTNEFWEVRIFVLFSSCFRLVFVLFLVLNDQSIGVSPQ